MTIDATQVGQTVEKTRIVESPAAHKAEVLTLQSGVAVRDAGLLPEKMLAIMDYYYRNINPNTGVAMIIPRSDGNPAGVCGLAFGQVFTYAINLDLIFKKAVSKVRNGKSFMDIRTTAWYGLLHTMLHESIHIEELGGEAPPEMDAAAEKELEDLINDVVKDKIVQLAQEINIEPPAVGDMGFIGAKMMELFVAEPKDEAIEKTQFMLEKGLIYMDESDKDKSVYHKTLREYVQVALGNPDDPAWEGTPAVVNMVYELENDETGEVAGEEPLPEPKLEVATETAAAAVASSIPGVIPVNEAGQAVVNEQAATPSMFGAVADGSEDDAGNPEAEVLAEVLDNDGEVVAETSAVITNPIDAAQAGMMAGVKNLSTASDVAGGHVAAPGNMGFPVPEQVAQMNTQAAETTPKAGGPYAGWTTPSLSPEQLKACLHEIYGRLFHALFTKGGWCQNAQTGRFHFAQPGKLLASISIDDILKRHNAEGLVAEYESMVPGTTQKVTEKCANGAIRGTCFSNGSGGWLPVFALHLNIGGERVVRKLVPQNPEKRDSNNAYKKSANEAAAGFAKAYVFADAPNDAPWAERCPLKLFYDYGTNSIRFEEQK